MVAISRRRRSRPALWKIRLALYGLSALALLFSVCLVLTDLIQQEAAKNDIMMLEPPHRKISRPLNAIDHSQDLTGTPGGVVTTPVDEITKKDGGPQTQIQERPDASKGRIEPEQKEVSHDEEERPAKLQQEDRRETTTEDVAGVLPEQQMPISKQELAEVAVGDVAKLQEESPSLESPSIAAEEETPQEDEPNQLGPSEVEVQILQAENIPQQQDELQPPDKDESIVQASSETLSETSVTTEHTAPDPDGPSTVVNLDRAEVNSTSSVLIDAPIIAKDEQRQPLDVQPMDKRSDEITLFVLVADSRAASDWILSRLDLHPEVCASSETGGLNNGEGYPLGCMLPDGMPWLQDSDARQGCILAFIRPKVKEFIHQSEYVEGKWKLPQRCQEDYDAHEDPIQVHLKRLCKFTALILERDEYDTSSDEAIDISITHAYMTAFQEDGQDLLACKCREATKVRGVKVLTDWIPKIHGFLDRHEGVKVLRLHRRNTFARYLSFQVAAKTNIWQSRSLEEKHRQLEALPSDWTVDVDDMLRSINEMERASAEADTWAYEHADDAGRDVFSFEYEGCRDRPEDCFVKIFSYLGIDGSDSWLESNKNNFVSTFQDSVISSPESLLKKISNNDLVKEALGGSDMGEYLGSEGTFRPIQHIQLHIDPFTSKRVNHHHPFMIGGVNRTSVYFEGEGLKFGPALNVLKSLPGDDVVALSIHDISSVVMLNPSLRSNSQAYQGRKDFRSAVGELARNRKVMVSTTDICCSAALSHAQPRSLIAFDTDSSTFERRAQSCNSGSPECLWETEDVAHTWKSAFESLALRAQKTTDTSQIFLDGSLLAGAASDVVDILEDLNIHGEEDERAVLVDYIIQDNAERLQLDYDSILVERQPFDIQRNTIQGCFEGDAKKVVNPLLHDNTKETLFIRTERELGCKPEVNLVRSHPVYPSWESGGIEILPIIQHIDDLLLHDKSIGDIDRHFGKEIFYAVTNNGIYSSNDSHEKYRTEPTERFIDRAFGLFRESLGSGVWPDLEKVMNGGGFPYFAWYGDYRGCNFHNKGDDSIPLFTTSATVGCKYSFPSPAYMSLIDGKLKPNEWFNYFQRFDHDFAWETKIRKVFWRGTLSESDPAAVKTSIRWRVNKYVADRADELYDIFDVGFTKIPEYVMSMAGVEASQAGGLKNEVKPMINFQKYLAILDMDGNSWSSRFSNLLCYNSVILKVEPGYVDDFYFHLAPWRHYIPVKNSLEDLEEMAKFVVDPSNENLVKEIVYNANQWCSEHMLQDRLAHDQIELWEKYVRLLNQGDVNWQSSWLQKKDEIFKDDSKYGLVALG